MNLTSTTVRADSPTTSDVGDAAAAITTTNQTFVTKETLGTFSGQVLAVTVIWKLFGGSDGSKLIPGLAVALISTAIWFSTIRKYKDAREEIPLSLMITGVNALMVYAAVIGADVSLDQAGLADATNPAIDDASK